MQAYPGLPVMMDFEALAAVTVHEWWCDRLDNDPEPIVDGLKPALPLFFRQAAAEPSPWRWLLGTPPKEGKDLALEESEAATLVHVAGALDNSRLVWGSRDHVEALVHDRLMAAIVKADVEAVRTLLYDNVVDAKRNRWLADVARDGRRSHTGGTWSRVSLSSVPLGGCARAGCA